MQQAVEQHIWQSCKMEGYSLDGFTAKLGEQQRATIMKVKNLNLLPLAEF